MIVKAISGFSPFELHSSKLQPIRNIVEVGDSLTEDWDLVCEREGLRATLGAVPMAGYLVGKVTGAGIHGQT